MNKYLMVLLIVAALFAASCDRFEHTFKPEPHSNNVTQALFNDIRTALDSISVSDVSSIMAFYDEDYLHNGQQKADREAFFLNLFNTSNDLNFEVTLQTSGVIEPGDTLSEVNWRLVITDAASQVIADSTFIGEEIVKRGETWLLYGNRNGCCPPPLYKQRVFIETFTYITCPNCPAVEALLHQLQLDNPYNLSYLEYHLSDPLDIGNLDVYGYYNYPDMPSVVFQGETMIIGNNASNEQFFNQLAEQIANTDASIVLANLDYTLAGQALSGSVRINVLDTNLDTGSLKLKYAILDKESADYTNAAGDPCRNVVLAKGTKSLSGADLSQSVNFNLPYAGILPQDSYLVIWAQVTPDPFSSNATIFNALESPITVNRKL